jgi:hypothetical protein
LRGAKPALEQRPVEFIRSDISNATSDVGALTLRWDVDDVNDDFA